MITYVIEMEYHKKNLLIKTKKLEKREDITSIIIKFSYC